MTVPTTMKAVVLHEADEMRVESRPVPKPAPGEALVKVNCASICGTDVKVLHRTLQGQPAGPFIMGHEYAGTVVALTSAGSVTPAVCARSSLTVTASSASLIAVR